MPYDQSNVSLAKLGPNQWSGPALYTLYYDDFDKSTLSNAEFNQLCYDFDVQGGDFIFIIDINAANQPQSSLNIVTETALVRAPSPLNGAAFTTGTGTFDPTLINEKSFNSPSQSPYPSLFNINYLGSGTSQYTTSFMTWVEGGGLEGFKRGDFLHLVLDGAVAPNATGLRNIELFTQRNISDVLQWFRYNQTVLAGSNFNLTNSITSAKQISQGFSHPQMLSVNMASTVAIADLGVITISTTNEEFELIHGFRLCAGDLFFARFSDTSYLFGLTQTSATQYSCVRIGA